MRPGATGAASSSSSITLEDEASLERTEKTLRALKRRRKQRHAKLRELTRDDEDEGRSTGVGAGWWDGERGDGMACPVCDQFVRGDVDVVEAHVDACLAHVRLTNEREERRRGGGRRGSADVNGDGDVEWDVVISGSAGCRSC